MNVAPVTLMTKKHQDVKRLKPIESVPKIVPQTNDVQVVISDLVSDSVVLDTTDTHHPFTLINAEDSPRNDSELTLT